VSEFDREAWTVLRSQTTRGCCAMGGGEGQSVVTGSCVRPLLLSGNRLEHRVYPFCLFTCCVFSDAVLLQPEVKGKGKGDLARLCFYSQKVKGKGKGKGDLATLCFYSQKVKVKVI